jgi:DNA-directed RNA polymerase subunit beta'
VEIGEAVGVIAAQSIGEPGTQLTMRTFHTGGTAQRITGQNSIKAKHEGVLEFTDNLQTLVRTYRGAEEVVVISRTTEVFIKHPQTGHVLQRADVPYASILHAKPGDFVQKGQEICSWDPYARHILSTQPGRVKWVDLIENETYRRERIEEAQQDEYIVIESSNRFLSPAIQILNDYDEPVETYTLPVGARIGVADGKTVQAGYILARTPVQAARTADITGGLPRVTELFEARSPNAAAVLAEIDGIVKIGRRRSNNHEIEIESPDSRMRVLHKVPTTRLLLVQTGDKVRAGQPLCDGPISPHDILRILGITAVAEYLLRNIQLIYAPQGVKISTKHLEIILRQMMQKVRIVDSGDTIFLQDEAVDKVELQQENALLSGRYIVTDPGDQENLQVGALLTPYQLTYYNETLKAAGKRPIEARPARPATAEPILLGISRAASTTRSWLSSASFQETVRVLIDAVVEAKTDELVGLKENVITGQKIPAGTGYLERYRDQVPKMPILVPEAVEATRASVAEASTAPKKASARTRRTSSKKASS